jgi:hypothetical protein
LDRQHVLSLLAGSLQAIVVSNTLDVSKKAAARIELFLMIFKIKTGPSKGKTRAELNEQLRNFKSSQSCSA